MMITNVIGEGWRSGLLAGVAAVAIIVPAQAIAQDDPDTPVPEETTPERADGATIYTPADFERFAPRNVLDMLQQVPGFSIQSGGQGRGLGQASDNVLINGERAASKSDGVFDQLRRITPDRVVQIEIVDGSTLGIPGLSGQVANIITRGGEISGQFEYRMMFRPEYAEPSFFGGNISVSGSSDDFEWSLAYNHGTGRGAAGGPGAYITDGMGNVTENRDIHLHFEGEFPSATGRVKWTSPGGTIANFSATYGRRYTDFSNDEMRDLVDGVDLFRDFDNRGRGYRYEFNGDIDFPLGPGRLKLIGLERFEHDTSRATSIFDFEDDSITTGNRFFTAGDSGETIGRAEYRWDMLGGSWQIDAEAAFNRLDQMSQLSILNPDGEFDEIEFPDGSGGVTEDRYEVILTHSRSLADDLTMILGAGGEYSQLSQSGPGGLTREFWRPKGSFTLGWTPGDDWDLSLKLSRVVGQLSFGDFLASVNLASENENAGNAELVPQQTWELDLEAKKNFGEWGSGTLRLYGRWGEDFIDLIPLPGGGEARGNIDRAALYGIRLDGTINLDPVGFDGAKLEFSGRLEETSVLDPLTMQNRGFSFHTDQRFEVSIRHDVPDSDWAWGAGIQYDHSLPYFRLSEVGRDYEGPIYTWAFVEHKDVFGMTLNFQVFNLTNGRALYERTVYDGPRTTAPILFTEHRDLSVQPIFRIQLRGDF